MKTILIFLTAALLLGGCAGKSSANPPSAGNISGAPVAVSSSEPEKAPIRESSAQESPKEEFAPEETPGESDNPLAGLTLNEYDGLEITAAVLTRTAILPGSVFPLTINIANTGDKTVSYVQGSGSFETPQALKVSFDGLQPVLPKDYLGISTRDFVTKQLKPGENLVFVANILAAGPDAQFDAYTYDLYNSENLYIADLEWGDLQTRRPGLVAAKSGSYTGTVDFIYSIVNGGEATAFFSDPTGYAETKVQVGVSA